MKKTLLAFTAVICVISAAVVVRVRKTAPSASETPTSPPTKFVLGEKTVFDMKFRLMTDEENRGGVVFSPWLEDIDSAFVEAVKGQTENAIALYRIDELKGREALVVEYKDKEILSAYFDVDGDGKLSAADRLEAVDFPGRPNRPGLVSFLTPEFSITTSQGRQMPTAILFRVSPSENADAGWWRGPPISVIGVDYGLYEGTAMMDGSEKTIRIVADYEDPDYINGLGSLVFQDNKFYRIFIEYGPDNKTVKLTYAEDIGPRGKYAIVADDISSEIKFWIRTTVITSVADETVLLFDIDSELPVGEYKLRRAVVAYGREGTALYTMEIKNSVFTILPDQTTAIKMEKPTLEILAIDEEKRYTENSPQYETEFVEGVFIHIDMKLANSNGTAFSGFRSGGASLNPRIRITDAEGKEVANAKLEYG